MIKKFTLEKIENISKEDVGNVEFECLYYENRKNKKLYCVSLHLITYTNKSKLDLTLDGIFEIPNNIEKSLKEYFLAVSAPAILYPYVRAFISNVTSFDIDETVVLPVVNFADLN